MNPSKTLSVLLFCAVTVFAQQSATDAVNAVRNRYKVEIAQLDTARTAVFTQLTSAYAKELVRAREAAQSKGDLDAVLQLNALITAATAGSAQAPPNAASLPVRTAHTTYERNLSAALRPLLTKRQQLDAAYSKDLTTLEQQYTRSGQIEAAKVAREARIELAKLAAEAKAQVPDAEVQVITSMSGAVLKQGERLASEKSFKPPVEVEWRVQTNGEFRFAYACGSIILNWGNPPYELRIDGGPAGFLHKKGAGSAPINRAISVKLSVLPAEMTLSVDGRERARWKADFSNVNQPVSVMVETDSVVKVDQVIVRKLK